MKRRSAILSLALVAIIPLLTALIVSSGVAFFGFEGLAILLHDVFGMNMTLAYIFSAAAIAGGLGGLIASCWFTGIGCSLAVAVSGFLFEYPEALHL